ncbi:MAG: hypothetical protein JWP02_1865 [Acidimicrobiales bacterium]|nr:hypothetical protein [Acidimicrobiales bacterium]
MTHGERPARTIGPRAKEYMNRIHKIAVGVALTGSTLAGGALGAALLNGSANAQTTTSTPGATSTAPADKSNNDAAHEAAETPAHEADETAGKAGGGGRGGNHASNKDPAHEAAESPARAAEEASRDAAIANGSSSTTAPGSPTTNN